MAFAALVFSQAKGPEWFAVIVGVVGFLLLIGGKEAIKTPESLASAQTTWDKSWVCARCGHQWQE
jgi:hypothetical protein